MTSYLNVNFSKRKIGVVGINLQNLCNYTAMLNCEIMKIPFTYMGMEVGGNHRRVIFWEVVIGKCWIDGNEHFYH